jgi:hypothetical protein
MKELAALAYGDTSPESREFWKNELGQAICEIEAMYEEKLVGMKADLESQYNHKVMHKNIFSVHGFFSNACTTLRVHRSSQHHPKPSIRPASI